MMDKGALRLGSGDQGLREWLKVLGARPRGLKAWAAYSYLLKWIRRSKMRALLIAY